MIVPSERNTYRWGEALLVACVLAACELSQPARDPGQGEGTGDAGSTTQGTGGSGSTGPAPVEPADPFALSQLCLSDADVLAWDGPPPSAAADVDGDRRADVIAVVHKQGAWRAAVFLGSDGGFTPEAVETPFDKGDAERFADVDGDGQTDLLVIGAALQVHHGEDDGSFGLADVITPLTDYRSVDFVDFDRDGRLDMVAADYQDEIQTLRGLGDGSFEPASRTSVASHASALVHASRAGTPSAGLVVGLAAGCLDCEDSAFSLLQIDPAGALSPRGSIEWGATWSMIGLTVGNLQGDEAAEVIVELGLDQRTVFGRVGDGLDVVGALPNGPLAFGDLNADGVAELVVVTDDELEVYDTMQADKTKVLTVTAPSATDVFVVDVDGNGTQDVVMFDQVGFDPQTGDLQPAIHVRRALPCDD